MYDDDYALVISINNMETLITTKYSVQLEWVFNSVTFIGSNSSQKIEFKPSHAGNSANNSYGSYMGIDGVHFLIPLSVELTSFKEKDLSLIWTTEKEDGFDKFEIEKSSEKSNDFIKVGEVYSYNKLKSKYTFKDNEGLEGVYLYRLKMIDKNGYFTYSDIVSVNYSIADYNASISPNPINSNSELLLTGFEEEVEIVIYNSFGRILY